MIKAAWHEILNLFNFSLTDLFSWLLFLSLKLLFVLINDKHAIFVLVCTANVFNNVRKQKFNDSDLAFLESLLNSKVHCEHLQACINYWTNIHQHALFVFDKTDKNKHRSSKCSLF